MVRHEALEPLAHYAGTPCRVYEHAERAAVTGWNSNT